MVRLYFFTKKKKKKKLAATFFEKLFTFLVEQKKKEGKRINWFCHKELGECSNSKLHKSNKSDEKRESTWATNSWVIAAKKSPSKFRFRFKGLSKQNLLLVRSSIAIKKCFVPKLGWNVFYFGTNDLKNELSKTSKRRMFL